MWSTFVLSLFMLLLNIAVAVLATIKLANIKKNYSITINNISVFLKENKAYIALIVAVTFAYVMVGIFLVMCMLLLTIWKDIILFPTLGLLLLFVFNLIVIGGIAGSFVIENNNYDEFRRIINSLNLRIKIDDYVSHNSGLLIAALAISGISATCIMFGFVAGYWSYMRNMTEREMTTYIVTTK